MGRSPDRGMGRVCAAANSITAITCHTYSAIPVVIAWASMRPWDSGAGLEGGGEG